MKWGLPPFLDKPISETSSPKSKHRTQGHSLGVFVLTQAHTQIHQSLQGTSASLYHVLHSHKVMVSHPSLKLLW